MKNDCYTLIHNTFFYSTISKNPPNVNRLRRTYNRRGVDSIHTLRQVLIPINAHHNHWCFASIDMDTFTIKVYDSLIGYTDLTSIVRPIEKYLKAEMTEIGNTADPTITRINFPQ